MARELFPEVIEVLDAARALGWTVRRMPRSDTDFVITMPRSKAFYRVLRAHWEPRFVRMPRAAKWGKIITPREMLRTLETDRPL